MCDVIHAYIPRARTLQSLPVLSRLFDAGQSGPRSLRSWGSPTDPARRADPFPEVTDWSADFLCLHCSRGCSPWRPGADIGTSSHDIYVISFGISRADASSLDTARDAVLYGAHSPDSGRTDSRASAPCQEKRTLPGTHTSVSEFGCVAALRHKSPCRVSGIFEDGNRNVIPGDWRKFGGVVCRPMGPVPPNRHCKKASEVRERFKNYFVSPEDAVPW